MRKERTPLGASKDRGEQYSGFREPDLPSYGGKQMDRPDQKRQSERTEGFFEKGQQPAFTGRRRRTQAELPYDKGLGWNCRILGIRHQTGRSGLAL